MYFIISEQECTSIRIYLKNDTADDFVEHSCSEEKSFLCKKKPDWSKINGAYDYNSRQAVCISDAFNGDISCDFESENWSEGDCNWQYSYLSKYSFNHYEEEPSLGNF